MTEFMQQLYVHQPQITAVRDFLELGGGILVLVIVFALLMWCLILERVYHLYRPYRHTIATIVDVWRRRGRHDNWHARKVRKLLISLAVQRLERNLKFIEALIKLCPLLGLLGTVTGMIEVFQVMAESGSGNPRSMATGVARATIPTFAGMIVALSGLGMSTWLNKRTAAERESLAARLTTISFVRDQRQYT